MTDHTRIPAVDVAALAKLSRLDVSPEELADLERTIPTILEFVAQVSGVATQGGETPTILKNVMRVDVPSHADGEHTEELLSQAPERSGNYVKVPQVIRK